MTPEAFCATMRRELAASPRDESWVRGASGLCEMYANTDTERFGSILEQLARGSPGSALAAGARWLLPRWHAARATGR